MEEERIKLRIKFSKHGAIRYIGHLDVMRYFQKVMRRAEIDVTYSTGYSPHQIMSFASPLSVGHESNGEYMDLEVNSLTSSDDFKNRMNAAGIPGIEVLSVKRLPEGANNAMASVAGALYSVYFKEGKKPDLDFERITPMFLALNEIPYEKETKKGSREMNLKEGIFEMSWEKDHFSMLLDASSAGNIKPSQILEAMCKMHETSLPENALFVVREETYLNISGTDEIKLAPLDVYAKEF